MVRDGASVGSCATSRPQHDLDQREGMYVCVCVCERLASGYVYVRERERVEREMVYSVSER